MDTQPMANAPIPPPALNEADQARMNNRAQRFFMGQEGHRNVRKKLSIDELIQPLVWNIWLVLSMQFNAHPPAERHRTGL